MIPRKLQVSIIVLILLLLGMGYYVLRLKQRSEELRQPEESQPAPVRAGGPTEPVTLYVADDSSASIRQQRAEITKAAEPQIRAQNMLRELTSFYMQKNSPHPLATGAEVRSVFLLQNGDAVIDLNSAFADSHRSGIMEEQLTIVSMVQTLASAAPDVKRVRFLVEGKERETLAGHADLRNWYDVAITAQLAHELQGSQ